MNYDVIHAEYADGYRLKLAFANGRDGVVDFLKFIEKGGVFEVLKEISLFKQFSIDPDWNTIVWNGGEIDVAPEMLYFEATGNWPVREPMMQVAEEPPPYGTDSE
ncbi:DUF2442 domain-containing protein [Pontiellaceae bacterium B12227]|nr:DUF2442 domain-containing protein [Pontiellaceae bacterium B12227]